MSDGSTPRITDPQNILFQKWLGGVQNSIVSPNTANNPAITDTNWDCLRKIARAISINNGTLPVVTDSFNTLLRKICRSASINASTLPALRDTDRQLLYKICRSIGTTPGYRNTVWSLLFKITDSYP
tara:strand:- start:230 stop:610 length:381 start_codon:yes stop_codon:yes gene_type:complete